MVSTWKPNIVALYAVDRWDSRVFTHIQSVVGDGGAGEDAVLLHEAGAAALGGGARGALGVVVEAGDDVSGRRALQVLGLVVGDAGFELSLSVRFG